MAPTVRQRSSVSKEKFHSYFAGLRTVSYQDTYSRSPLKTIAWNPLGTLIATGSNDSTLRVWNPDRTNVKYTTELKGHEGRIVKIAFNPVKEAELCSLSVDGVVKFWDVRTKKMINEVKGLGEASTLAWHPDGKNLIVGNKSNDLYILSPTEEAPISSHQQPVDTNQVTFCNSGKKVFLTTGAGETKILSYPEFEPMLFLNHDPTTPFVLRGHTTPCGSVEMQPTGRFLATGGSDSIICLWDTTEWICQRTLCEMTGPVTSISFSFDGSYIVGGSNEGTGLEIAHTESGEYVYSIKTSNPAEAVAWHPSKYILAYTDGRDLRITGVDPERR